MRWLDDHREHETSRERGSSLLVSIGGVAVFLAFMLFAAQLLANLHATSVVTSAAHEAALSVAGTGDPAEEPVNQATAQARAEDALRRRLGGYGAGASLDWSGGDADEVVLHVAVESPSILPPALAGGLLDEVIERTVHVRREIWR